VIIIAPPRALGPCCGQTYSMAAAAITRENHKDFVRLPVHEIERNLKG